MATIGKIRKRSGLLLIVIGGAMAAFILGDFFSGGGGGRQELNVGEINGDEINSRDFEYRVENLAQAQKSVGANIDENTRQQLRDQVWNNIVREHTIEKEFEKLGLAVSKDEYDDVRFGNNILDFIASNQQFQNPETGAFDPNQVRNFFAVIQEQYPMYWKLQKDNVIKSRIQEKYFNLVSKGIYVNRLQAKSDYFAKNTTANINFVFKAYNSIPDSAVSFTESELKDYYNEHKNEAKYKQAESRSIDFISFEKVATEEDKEAMRAELNDLAEEFRTTDNDSLFVVTNGTVPFYQAQVYAEGTAPAPYDSMIVNAAVGTVVGPYAQGNIMQISKVVVNGMVPEVNARHILLKPTATVTIEDLEAKADSLIKELKKNKNFEAVAATMSEDRGSAANGGNLDWFGKGQMVKPFEEAAFATSKGGLTKATSQFGVHVIEVLDRREVEQVQIAVVSLEIEPSPQTVEELYNNASEFSISNDDADAFYASAKEQGYAVKSAPDVVPGASFLPGGLGANAQKVSRWMQGAELGDVSEPLELDNQFVVAILTDISEKGAPTLSKVRSQMERELIREKKAALWQEKLAGSDLNAIASANGLEVKTANGISFSTVNIPGAGREPKIVGQALTLPKGSISVPLKGEMGVYVIQVNDVIKPSEPSNYASNIQAVKTTMNSRAQNSAYQALIEQAEIDDNRYKYYY